ncbi:hypothetical protein CPJCM30710_11010 [Clostridium polyendosporum]|uniref:GmrSD restriction endonucleases N-terminal domain-containing protein n=1 Tax=Clostridium polyendosporum TaxID=69208 RepID=A0A919RZM8_9CLOT|nr:DUF262 domain-containing protein [Clostridium polyendosporum]GIM28435.1 hypothetical protein CPJCM30710_11010 [Clostridium polyendosporum]
MELYLKILNNNILDAYTENYKNQCIQFKIKDMDDFFQQTSKYNEVDEEIEEKVRELIETSDTESLDAFNIKHWVSNRSFGELIDMYENEEIIKPDMQREFVWDALKCSRLIESIVLGLPIPPLFLLEVDKNRYELIDGYQRLTTVVNYVKGNPWHGKSTSKRTVKSKLSSKVSKELQGKSFEQLEDAYKRIIKRSTIPLIEFKQLEPNNLSSKYLIFERINTGSEKLNSMQIRKSLAHGDFIKELYRYANSNSLFTELFSSSSIKKDQHVEAFLRIMAMSDIYYKRYTPETSGINNILNEYCERKRNDIISKDYIAEFEKAMKFLHKVFSSNDMFKRVEVINDQYVFSGNLNVSIMESFMGTILNTASESIVEVDSIRGRYCEIMYKTLEKSQKKEEDNPFTTSTGSLESIENRFKICKKILVK